MALVKKYVGWFLLIFCFVLLLTGLASDNKGGVSFIPYTWAFGLAKTGNNIAVDSTVIMTCSRAADSIDRLKIQMALDARKATVLTINGVSQDLSVDRTWVTAPTNAQVLAALAFTPYNSTNPSSYITQAGARTAVSLTTTGTSGASSYNNSTGVFNIPNYANSGGTVTSIGLTSTDFSVSGSPVTTSGNITANLNTTGVSAGTYNASYTVDTKGRITAATNQSFNSAPSRSLSTTGSNNTYTISTTKNAHVVYTINFAFALTLTTSNGYVELDYSTDGGSNWITVSSVSSVFSLSVTLAGNTDAVLTGYIPANALVRLYRINNTNVTITASTSKQQEVTY